MDETGWDNRMIMLRSIRDEQKKSRKKLNSQSIEQCVFVCVVRAAQATKTGGL